MPSRYTVWFDEDRASEVASVGGKFANLAKLHAAGVRVPPAFSVSTPAYEAFTGGLRTRIEEVLDKIDYRSVESIDAASRRLRGLFEDSEIPSEISREISIAYEGFAKRTGESSGPPVAVRSSATSEDLLEASLAGQHETFLWVRGAEQVNKRVRDCWASIFTSRSIGYRHEKKLDPIGGKMAVVVQRMVPSSASGVMFTLNPTNGDRSKIAIESCWGLGELLVGGLVTPDFYLLDKVTNEVLQRRPGKKGKELVVVGDRLEEREVPPDRQEVLSLSDDQVAELAKSGKQIETYYKTPQDIEWALDSSKGSPGNFFILQARPETVWRNKVKESGREAKSAIDLVVDKLTKG